MTARERERIHLRDVARRTCKAIGTLQRDLCVELHHGMPTAETLTALGAARDTLYHTQHQRGYTVRAKSTSSARAEWLAEVAAAKRMQERIKAHGPIGKVDDSHSYAGRA